MPKRLMPVIAILIALTGPVRAESTDCSELTSNAEMSACEARRHEAADKELNRVYEAALASIAKADHLTKAQRKEWESAVRKAQRNWIAFRDADCDDMIGWEWYGGSGRSLASASCMVQRTEQRSSELKSRYLGE